MTNMTRSWTVASCLLVTATTGFTVLAQDLPLHGSGGTNFHLPAPIPIGIVRPSMMRSEAELVYIHENRRSNCSGPIEQWNRRCIARAQDRFWGYPEEFVDAPLGGALEAHLSLQVLNGQAARMVLYQYDFFPLSNQLKPRGKAELARIAAWLPQTFCPVLVEPTPGRPELDEERRNAVWQELGNGPYPIPSDRVVVGRPGTRGLAGDEALVIDRNRLMQTLSRGASGSGAGAGQGSDASSGLSGSK